jgi:hypothetical protein
MKKLKRFSLAGLSLTAMLLITSFASNAQALKVAGTWNLTVETGQGTGTPVIVFKQEKDSILTGNYKGQLGEAPVKGILNGNKIRFEFTAQEILIEYTGTVEANTMKGTVKFGTLGEGTFTGKKKDE